MEMKLTRRRAVALALIVTAVGGAFTLMAGRGAEETVVVVAPDSTPVAPTGEHSPSQDPVPVPVPIPIPVPIPAPAPGPAPDTLAAPATAPAPAKYRAGESPDFAAKKGWPVKGPAALPGSILPEQRIVAYYGNPLSKRMGVLGEYEPAEMLRRFDRQLEEWRDADPVTPVLPALHLIAVVAQGDAGPSGKYRAIMRDSLVELVYGWAKSKNAILILDIQTGHSGIRELLPRFDHFLSRPDVHVGIDPEFMMKAGHKPGTKIGTIDASDINYATAHLAELVRKHDLPPKVLVIHRFTRGMVTNASAVELRPEVQIVMHMDGWGAPWLKRDSYKDYIVSEPVQYTGFKLFYHNDTKKGDSLMAPADLLKLRPVPLYVQYQ
jgi:hypothetical protein